MPNFTNELKFKDKGIIYGVLLQHNPSTREIKLVVRKYRVDGDFYETKCSYDERGLARILFGMFGGQYKEVTYPEKQFTKPRKRTN